VRISGLSIAGTSLPGEWGKTTRGEETMSWEIQGDSDDERDDEEESDDLDGWLWVVAMKRL
jgi:hypothetical protein